MNYIERLRPSGTNSTHFTKCCGCAICDDEKRCPSCDELIIGHDANTPYERGRIRWAYATALW